jgi:hypothetical protein
MSRLLDGYGNASPSEAAGAAKQKSSVGMAEISRAHTGNRIGHNRAGDPPLEPVLCGLSSSPDFISFEHSTTAPDLAGIARTALGDRRDPVAKAHSIDARQVLTCVWF